MSAGKFFIFRGKTTRMGKALTARELISPSNGVYLVAQSLMPCKTSKPDVSLPCLWDESVTALRNLISSGIFHFLRRQSPTVLLLLVSRHALQRALTWKSALFCHPNHFKKFHKISEHTYGTRATFIQTVTGFLISEIPARTAF